MELKEQGRFERLSGRASAWRRAYGPELTAAYMKERCGEETGALLERADQLMEQTFVFADPWDMEPCGVPCTLRPMVWDQTPNGDPEWVYMLNRHDFLRKLMTAYRLTGRQAYADKLKWYMADWIKSNPIRPQGGETIRTIDTGIRCMNWAELLLELLAEGLVSGEETEAVLGSMSAQFTYLREAYIEKYTLSNWGLLQTGAMCFAFLWFEEYLPGGGLVQWAWEELKEQLALQVMEDGSHWEQSIMYHMEVLNCCMKLWTGCRLAGVDAPEWLQKTVESMSRYVLFAAGPDHRQLAQADSDVTDVRDVLTKAAVLCGRPEFKFGGFPAMDLDSARLLGAEGIRAYERMEAAEPEETTMVCRDTGNIYLRSGWDSSASYTYLHCGPLGSAHGHGDQTQICLYYGGKPFLVDSGRYSYREDEPLRMYFKEAEAHNVCVIDGQPQARADGSWSYRSFGECLRNSCSENGPVHFVEMAYHGQLDDGTPYLVKRRVMFHDLGFWLVVNDICCQGRHTAGEYYHLDSAVQVRDGGSRQNGSGSGGISRPASLLLESGGKGLRVFGDGPFSAEPCPLSGRYNELEESARLVRRAPFEDRMTSWTAFAGEGTAVGEAPVYRAGGGAPVDPSAVTAVEYAIGDESWVFLVWNRETFQGPKLYRCRQVPVYGRAAALHIRAGEAERFRL